MENRPELPIEKTLPTAICSLNTLVVECPITIEIETFYDLNLPETWDDRCLLWSVDDDGAICQKEVALTNSAFVQKEEKTIKIIFEDILADHNYSCVIMQDEDKSVVLFQNLLITEDMAIENE